MDALNFPARAELADRRSPILTVGSGALVCVGTGTVMVRAGSSLGWLVLGLGAVFVALIVTMRISPSRLVVAPDGFGLSTLLDRSLTPWTEVSAFRAGVPPFGGAGGRTVIMYDRTGRRAPVVLPADFGINAQTLAEQLETYRLDAVFAAENPAPAM